MLFRQDKANLPECLLAFASIVMGAILMAKKSEKSEDMNRVTEIIPAAESEKLARPQRALGQVDGALRLVQQALAGLDVTATDLAPSLEDALNGLINVQSQLMLAQLALTRIAGVHARNFR